MRKSYSPFKFKRGWGISPNFGLVLVGLFKPKLNKVFAPAITHLLQGGLETERNDAAHGVIDLAGKGSGF